MYTLVVCEKPDAARRIAQALGDPKESKPAGISVFDVANSDCHYKVCSALGHLYGLADSTKNRSVYPVLDLEWAPVDKNPRAARAIKVISELSKNASAFVHACDYDQEGEVIGHNILQYACGGKYEKALRAKFSTLTDEEIRESFASLERPSGGLAEAGRSRHMLDFIYGVNLSRALAQSLKMASNGYCNLSIGRVQGPTLAFAVDRELEIRLHVPDPYWTIAAQFEKNNQTFSAQYEKPKVGTLAEAKSIVSACIGRDGTVSDVVDSKAVLGPPTPFNIGDLQREAYRLFKLGPGYTLAIAEKLYLQALISYPRTSSQKLPPSIGYGKIISSLSRIGGYGQLTSMLLSKGRLVPNEGRMTDPAHPAIYPTGVAPQQKLSSLEFKVYDLVVKRFLATFGDPAISRHTDVSIDVNSHTFKAQGRSPVYEGWMVFYKPHVRLEQHELPELRKGDLVKNLGIDMEEKFTQPPYRYNQASLLAKMEQEQIGTKATRADIIATLFKRNYIASSVRGGIEVTDLGFAVIDSMRTFVPAIISTSLTRSMEEQLEKVEQGSAESVLVIEQAVDKLIESLSAFIEKEVDIGARIGNAASSSANGAQAATMIGSCPVCKKGQLRMIKSYKTKKRFVGCSNYSGGCKATAPLPQKGAIRVLGKACPECGWPIVGVVFARRSKHWKICVNMQCPSKKK
ncbi:DNA topoisomerase IA [Candidatus Nitrososphaera gargensis Ga9.2]|uniref:DNA topoisomerase 1 n=1 Tax=Nitrososphaera gargensis (strain Ga9.2) TaxID=1237085 RepID=K0IBM4_NITGG|nr:DNA topoisomerase I [Candidatus Nitrososphaera gargensis]AFU56965.1 DNA topoisomerase IA [Candidatus Nitrososphaera gargensis Ga9.2]